MAFDNHTLQSEQHTTIGFVRVELVPQRLEGAAGEQIADLGLPAARHRIAQKIRHLARGAFGGLQRDVAAETFRHDHVSRARADPVALDEADIVELRQVHRAQLFRRLANLLAALDLLDPDIEQADGRTLQAEQHARHRAAHHRQRHQMMRIAADAGAEIEHDGIAARRRPYAGNGRPVDAGHGVQMEARHRHQRAGIAGGNRHVGLALLHRVDRKPHRRVLAAAAQRLARLVVHADGDVGMDHARGLLQRRIFGELLVDLLAVAIEQKFAVGMPLQRDGGAGNDDRCADIATHGVKRDSNLLRHERPGNLISCGPRRARPRTGKAPPKRCSAKRNAAPPPGRDNSVSLSRHNLLTTLFWRKASAVARNQEHTNISI